MTTPDPRTDLAGYLGLTDERAARCHKAPVGTVVVADALPIVKETGDHDAEIYPIYTGDDLAIQRVVGDPWIAANVLTEWITDQLPLGDFTPGRWGWLLTDPESCDPVPVRGRQGVWEWTP